MNYSKLIPRISTVVILLSLMFSSNALADNIIAADVFQPYINRIIWVSWHSGSKSFETEGTLKEIIGDHNCISLIVRAKFPDEEIRFEGERMLYINLSVIDAFEIRKPR